MGVSDQLADRPYAVGATPLVDLVAHPLDAARVGEAGGADLARGGAGQHELDGVDAAGHAADPDDGQLGEVTVHLVDSAHGDGVDRRTRQPASTATQPGPAGLGVD